MTHAKMGRSMKKRAMAYFPAAVLRGSAAERAACR